jgi:hypothetical protein
MRFQGGYLDISKELTMTKSILVSLAVLTLATSSALAAQRYHRQPMASASAVAPAPAPAPVMWMGGVSNSDRDMYIRNLRDSGYDTKRNLNSFGNVATQ